MKIPNDVVKLTKFQYQVLKNIDIRNDRTYEDLYWAFCGERTRSAIRSCLHTLISKKLLYIQNNGANVMASYFLTDLGKKSYTYFCRKRGRYFWDNNPFPKTKIGLCDKCKLKVEKLTRVKKSETKEGENTYSYLCRKCLCSDDDLSLEREVNVRRGHHLRTAEDFETISSGDLGMLQKSLKKHGKGFKTRFGRM